MQVWMVFGAVFCFRKIFGEILQKIGEISSRPSGNTAAAIIFNKHGRFRAYTHKDNFHQNYLCAYKTSCPDI